MNEYEIMLLTRSDLDEATRTSVIDRAKEAITSHGGTVGDLVDWGRRTTTYPIQKLEDAHYSLLNFDGTGETVDEAVRVLRITDGVLRVMAVNRVPAYPAEAALETITDEELASGPAKRDGRSGGSGGRGRRRD